LQLAGDAAAAALGAWLSGALAHPWGLVELALDEDLASGAQVGVKRLVAVLPDGEVVAVPGSLPPPPPHDVDDQVRGQIVYLTLPARQEGAVLFTRPDSADANVTRYLIAEREAVDQTDPDRNSEAVEVALPNLNFGITEAELAGRTRIGIARIRERVGRKIIWDDAYIPPVLDIRASPTLAGFLVDIIGRLEQRQDELSMRAVEGADGGSETFAAYLLLQLLNRWQPELKHLQRL
jgi:type VI secretion system protein ImpJ